MEVERRKISESTALLDESTVQEETEPPKDKYHLAYIIFYLLGVGCLVPWNAFIMLEPYYKVKLGEGNKFQHNVLPYFTTGFQLTNITLLVFASGIVNKIPTEYRIGIPLIIQFLAFVGILAMVKIDVTGNDFFYFTLMLVLISAASTSFFQGGLFGLAGMLPFEYTQALMGGQGLGGVIVAGLNIITLVIIPKDAVEAAFIFFIISVVVLLICVVSFWLLEHLPIVHYYTVAPPEPVEHVPTKTLLWQLSPMACPVFLVFVVSLAVFPSIGVTVQSQHTHSNRALFISLYCFGGFALGDLIGRTLAPRILWPPKDKPSMMKWPVLARIVFIPLMMMCDVHTGLGDRPDFSLMPRVFKSDVAPYALMLLIGTTNGYFSTLCMMYGPGLVDKNETERAGFLMLLALVVGLLAGSFGAFAILGILCECNSFISPDQSSNSTDGVF